MHPELTRPPSIPRDAVYTSCYCEENIYLLSQRFSADPDITKNWDMFVVFISNRNKTVALWYQKLGSESHRPVIWDYHVVLVLQPRDHVRSRNVPEAHVAPASEVDESLSRRAWTYDFDTSLDIPCTLQDYLDRTFKEASSDFQSLFRTMPSSTYLDYFASDRSHMFWVKPEDDTNRSTEISQVPADSDYHSPPPLYEPIRGRIALEHGISNNLLSGFVCMDDSENAYGDVVGIDSLRLWGC